MSGICTHILSDVLYNYCLRVRYVIVLLRAQSFIFLKNPGAFKISVFVNILTVATQFLFLRVLRNTSPEWKMSRPWRRFMPIPPEKIMARHQTTISHRGSQVNRTVKQHLPKYVAFMNRVSNNIRKWWTKSSIWEITVDSISSNPSCLSYRRRVPQHFLILTNLLRPRTGFETWNEN